MASSSGNILSETLREITTTKLEELSKSRDEFSNRKAGITARLQSEDDGANRLAILCDGVKRCFGVKTDKFGKVIRGQTNNPALEIELKNLDLLLAQARYDPSVSTKSFGDWESSMLRHLEAQTLKFRFASLYAELVTEWLSSEQSAEDSETTYNRNGPSREAKSESRLEWERNVFAAAEVDESKLQGFLANLFDDEDKPMKRSTNALKLLSEKIAAFEVELSSPTQFTSSSLRWAIQGLLTSNLLSDEKREVLKGFQGNNIILAEVADVLNMRITALDSWSWGTSVSVQQMRKISGVYDIHMHEDLLQAIFLQYVGVKWSVFFKLAFRNLRKFGGPWIDVRANVPKIDKKRLGYYLGPVQTDPSVQHTRRRLFRQHYFLAHLLDSENQHIQTVDGEEEAEVQTAGLMKQMASRSAQPSAQSGGRGQGKGGAKRHRKILPKRDPEDSETDAEQDDSQSSKKPMDAKQRLLHILSTEIAVNTRIHGEITAFRSSFVTWNALLPHATIRTVLAFFGVSSLWLDFFMKFLEAPLRFLDEDESVAPRVRRRGTPTSHVLSEVFGEVVLFCLDFSINQSTNGSPLYRLQDDLWFWGPDHQLAVKAWDAIRQFASVTGTKLNMSKSGTVRIVGASDAALPIDPSLPQGRICWGFLRLSPETGRFEINQEMVDSHIEELQKQLQSKRSSIFAFIQTWNAYASTFFTSNFGSPANCFGRDHVDLMLATHSRIQREVFSAESTVHAGEGGEAASVVDYLKGVLEKRFNVSDIPDAYLFFPVELGGLDLQSPFISILQIRDSILKDSSELLDQFEESERDEYNRVKAAFEKGEVVQQRYALEDPDWEPAEKRDREVFMSFEEFTRWREEFTFDFDHRLSDVYEELLEKPKEESLELDNARIASGISALNRQENLRGILGDWHRMEPYWRWVVMQYGPEIMDRFEGLNIVDAGLLPMGAHRAHIALAELKIPFEEEIIDLSVPRTQEYLKVNPRGLVPSLEYDGKVITESAIVSTFLADAFPSGLVPPSTDPNGPLVRARIAFFVDTYFSKVQGVLMKAQLSKSQEDLESFATEFVNLVAKEIDPLLTDAAPFFGGSSKLTLAEVLTGSFILRVYSFPKFDLLPKSILSDLASKAPNFDKWAQEVIRSPSVTSVWDEENVGSKTKERLAKLKASA
ncbi:hypothetical protein BJ170DRAFT_679658 [Xylariales sp. AK1849]|nr:hypothetical protein BJ170DRAFT_679658 [Xylariales sp. AK1849]